MEVMKKLLLRCLIILIGIGLLSLIFHFSVEDMADIFVICVTLLVLPDVIKEKTLSISSKIAVVVPVSAVFLAIQYSIYGMSKKMYDYIVLLTVVVVISAAMCWTEKRKGDSM